jgi:hypothetical protein
LKRSGKQKNCIVEERFYIRMRTYSERAIWVLVSAITNVAGLPTVALNWQKGRVFESVIMSYTFLTSFMYHLCDSLELKGNRGLWLSEGQWHRQDNVGAIMCFVLFFIYLADFQNIDHANLCKYCFLCLVILLQEKSPWNLNFTTGPIIASFILFIAKRMIMDGGKFPACNRKYLKIAAVWHSIGFVCFVKGLDEHTDPYRMFHGGWHMFTGIAGYYDWQLILKRKVKSDDGDDDHP